MSAEPTTVWDGFRWVEVEAEVLPPIKNSFATRRLTEEEQMMQDAQQRLVKLKRDVAAQKAERARIQYVESKQRDAQEVRRAMDEAVGKDAIRDVYKVKAAEEDVVQEMAAALNKQLLEDFQLEPSQRSRGWIRLWRETDVHGVGRVTYEAFIRMLRSRLHSILRRKTRTKKDEVTQMLKALWRTLDDDGYGELKGYLELSQFLAFCKLGVPQGEEEEEGKPQGWKERMQLRRKADAEALRLERKQRQEADELMTGLELWQNEMQGVVPASSGQVRELAASLNARMQDEGWYQLYKRVDRSGDGRISWMELTTVLGREQLLPNDDDSQLRRVWKALDPGCTGFLSLNEFGSFMKLGAQRPLPPPTLQQLRAQRSRVTADHELLKAQDGHRRTQTEKRHQISEAADRLQRELAALKREPVAGHSPRQRAQTDRSHYKDILYRDADRSHYLGEESAMSHRRTLSTYRSVQRRFRVG